MREDHVASHELEEVLDPYLVEPAVVGDELQAQARRTRTGTALTHAVALDNLQKMVEINKRTCRLFNNFT